MWKLTLLILFPFSTIFGQDFTKKEEKRMKSILKKSSSSIRDFNKNSLMSIERTSNENVEALLENALFSAGFKVVSNKVAKEALNATNTRNENTNTIEISKSLTFKSVYVITISANIFDGSVIGRSCGGYLKSFTARIIDLASEGKLVGVFKFSGSLECIEDVTNAFAFSLLNEKPEG